ncbi:MAG: T9SS type A sorting domain-containing protein [Flavobacterium sp.]|nr:T9SS type A sorting domain-containing protein [Flavobacterium sp.]
MSSDLEWVVFVRNFDGIWAGNELYISHKAALSVIKNETNNSFTVIPNPTSGKIAISKATTLNSNEDYSIAIYDATGKLLLEKKRATEIDLTDYAAGIYFAKITGGTFSEVQKIIRN